MDFFQSHQTVQAVAILPSSIFPNVQLLVKRLAGSPKGAEIDPNLPHANKSVTQGSTRILIYIDGLFSRTKLCQAVAILPSSIFPERSIALVNDWLVQKELKLIPTCPTLTKCYPR
jgi:hypothetical protein